MKSVFVLFLLASTLYSQPLNLNSNNSIEGYYTVFNGVEIILKKDSYSLLKDSLIINKKQIEGQKIFLNSDNMQYSAVVNFGFKEESDYPVTIDIFNGNFDVASYSFTAPYGLPHPSINLSDNGNVFLFNPLNYEVTEYSKEGKKEYNIEKSVEFEMERSFFSRIKNGKYYLLISERPLSPEEDAENVYLYTSDLFFQNIEKKNIDIEVPVYLGFSDSRVIVSGVEFNESAMLPKTFIIDEKVTKEIPVAFEEMADYGGDIIAKYGKTLYKLSSNFEILSSLEFENNILDIAVKDTELFVLTVSNGWRILSIGSDLKIESDFPLGDVGSGNLPVLSASGGKLLLYDNNKTYIINEFVRRNK